MGWREHRITQYLKKYDEKLFVSVNYKGVRQILREHYTYKPYDVDGVTIQCLEPAHFHVVSLTDTWTDLGEPVDWGMLPIWQKLCEMDCWSRQSFINSEFYDLQEKAKKSKERDFENKAEAMAYELRDSFKKTFSDVNISLLDKTEHKLINKEKTVKFKGE